MENAKVGVFEDDKNWHEILTEIIEDNGHAVVVGVRTIEDARTAIEGLEEGSLDVAVVDGNLDPERYSGADGAEVTRLLREKFGEVVTVIGCSGGKGIEGVDHFVDKGGHPDQEIPALIAGI